MKIKTKLRLGFGFLFTLVLFFGAVSLYYMNAISASSKVVLKDNYKSITYIANMRAILEDYPDAMPVAAIEAYKAQLALEEANVTEKGEQEAVRLLRNAIGIIGNPGAGLSERQQALRTSRQLLRTIDQINMQAIVRKNAFAQRSVEQAATYLIFAASFCFLILFSFSVNFPGFVANPLREFSEAIKEIARKNYKQRLEFHGQDEFSELAEEFNAMTAQLNRWENSNLAKLQSEKLRIEAIIEQMEDAIIGLNERDEILFLNRVAANLLNLNEKEVIGSSASELRKRNDLLNRILQIQTLDKPLKIYANGKESYFQLERREITITNFESQADETLTAMGKTAGEVCILKNITRYKELDEAKTNFIATVSHELKTPIAAIKMSLKLMNDERVGSMNPEQTELIKHIKGDCDRLLKITSELLNMAQAETGNLQLKFSKTEPVKIAKYAMDAMRFQAAQRGVELELFCDDQLPMVNVDVEKTAWVLINFLSNALRYSAAQSSVIVRLRAAMDQVEFAVQDFGKGIEEQYQEKLFDRYFQVPADGNNRSGSGLGLAISKDFIEAENGKIWVESALGEGSTFTFSIPVAS